MNKQWLNKLEEMLNNEFSYNGAYDYEDMKLVVVCNNYADDAFHYGWLDFEELITLSNWVRLMWNAEFDELSNEEQGYIQEYAYRILDENNHEIFNIILRSKKDE
jgi:hypothetical protein